MRNQSVAFLAAFLSIVSIYSQQGNIEGVIIDGQGLQIPYATVIIEDIQKGTVSDVNGKFLFLNVPTGSHTLKIEYLGYADKKVSVDVNTAETTELTITLISQAESLNDVVVVGQLSGQARAYNTQKNKLNITNIVSTDQIGKFPDANIGDAMKRIPGITMQVDQGEARDIIIRGLAPQLNSVTLNGSRIPSAEGDNRNIQMDLIPADMIQIIEVNKAVTPDMDGDALGGSVNLVTRTAPEGFRLSATAGSGLSFITNRRIINGAFILGDRTQDGKFGWMVSASYNDADFGSDNFEAEWNNELDFTDNNGEEQTIDVNPYTDVFEQRTYLVQRIRRSFTANFDYNFDANNKIYLKSMYNWRDDRENRFVIANEILDGEDLTEDDFVIENNTPIRFLTEAARETKAGIDNDRNQNTRLEDQRMQNYTLGGEHLIGDLKFDWMGSYAKASEERLNERYAQYTSEYQVFNNNVDPEFPIMTAVNPADANDLDAFEFDEITEENQYTEEEDINVFLNLELPANFFDNGDGYVKVGLRGRFKNKFRDNDFFEYDFEDEFGTLADIPVRDYSDPDILAGSQYQAGIFPDPEWLGSLSLGPNADNGEPVPDEFLRANYDVEENVYASYAMTSQKLSEKFTVLAGLRVEHTSITATGNDIIDEEETIGEITDESSYTNVLPSVHLKYDFNERTVLRFAWSNTLARPNYEDLVPFTDVVSQDEEIFLGNPELDATTSMAFDLMAEYYFQNVGILSGGLFFKDISDFIYVQQSEDEDTGFDLFQPRNGEGATIFGAEFAFQRQLDFLPSFLKNLNVYLNYTYLTSNADGFANEDGDERSDLDLPGTAPNMFNASLAYNDKKFNIRFSVNYSDAYIDELGGNEFEDRYYDEQFFADFNVNYAITPNLRIYADLLNITDQPLRFYQGVSNRTMQAEYYGRRLTFGLKYDLFKKNQ